MNDMVENIQVIDRAWPVHQPTEAELVDEYEREAMFRSYNWIAELDDQDKSEIICAAVQACFRDDPSFKCDADKLAFIKSPLIAIIEARAEKLAAEEE